MYICDCYPRPMPRKRRNAFFGTEEQSSSLFCCVIPYARWPLRKLGIPTPTGYVRYFTDRCLLPLARSGASHVGCEVSQNLACRNQAKFPFFAVHKDVVFQQPPNHSGKTKRRFVQCKYLKLLLRRRRRRLVKGGSHQKRGSSSSLRCHGELRDWRLKSGRQSLFVGINKHVLWRDPTRSWPSQHHQCHHQHRMAVTVGTSSAEKMVPSKLLILLFVVRV